MQKTYCSEEKCYPKANRVEKSFKEPSGILQVIFLPILMAAHLTQKSWGGAAPPVSSALQSPCMTVKKWSHQLSVKGKRRSKRHWFQHCSHPKMQYQHRNCSDAQLHVLDQSQHAQPWADNTPLNCRAALQLLENAVKIVSWTGQGMKWTSPKKLPITANKDAEIFNEAQVELISSFLNTLPSSQHSKGQ